MSFQSQNPFSSESLFTCSLHYVLHLLHIILTFAHLSWQVPRSSVGRALYRESGPSQDGDPDLGDLPFSFFSFPLSLLFLYTLKLRTCIGTQLSFNINKSRNIVSAVKSFQSQNTFYSESLPTCFLQYIVHLLHIILKFAFLSWQVPRSSVGRALYRESGPSQDGDPDPGNLPFSFFFFLFF